MAFYTLDASSVQRWEPDGVGGWTMVESIQSDVGGTSLARDKNGYLWIADHVVGKLYKINPDTMLSIQTWNVDTGITSLAFDIDNNLWYYIFTGTSAYIRKVSPITPTTILEQFNVSNMQGDNNHGSIATAGSESTGVTYQAIWVCKKTKLHKVNLNTGAILQTTDLVAGLDSGHEILDLTAISEDFLAASGEGDLYRIPYPYNGIVKEQIDVTLHAWPGIAHDGWLFPNRAPNKPVQQTLTDNQTITAEDASRAVWNYSDPDGDGQTQYELRVRPTSSATWTTHTRTTSETFHDFAASHFTAGDYVWQVRVYDGSLWSQWSGEEYFTVVPTPDPATITSPTDAAVIDGNSVDVQWSIPLGFAQTKYQVKSYADSGGVPDYNEVLYDSGVVTSDQKVHTVPLPVNNRTEHLEVRYQSSDGVWADYSATVSINVAYVEPPTPTVVVTANSSLGYVTFGITNPAGGVDDPTVEYNLLYRRRQGSTSEWKLIADNITVDGSFDDHTLATKITYEYYVAAMGDNGITANSNVQTTSIILEDWWLKDPSDYANNIQIEVEQDELIIDTPKDISFFEPLGREKKVAVEDVVRGDEFRLNLAVVNESDYENLKELLTSTKTLLIQSTVYGEQWYVRIKSPVKRTILNSVDPYAHFPIDFVEVDDV